LKALLQRVSTASVEVEGKVVGEIGQGLLVLLGLDRDDNEEVARRLLEKLLNYRVFSDSDGRMNCSVRDVDGGVLLVSQFTLSAATDKGLRPSFTSAMAPGEAEPLYLRCCEILRASHEHVATGIFAADMQVSLVNDGPVSFLLEVNPG
jgi:D-aminoacyl-tRNA deacylase